MFPTELQSAGTSNLSLLASARRKPTWTLPGWVSVLFEDTYFASLIHTPRRMRSNSNGSERSN